MSTDLERALEDHEYLETLVDSAAPLARFLRRAGAFYQAHHEEIDYTDWNGAIVGRGPGQELRAAIPPDPTLPYAELAPLLELGSFARRLVALHPATPRAVLISLAEDRDWDVRHALTKRQDAEVVLAGFSPEQVARMRGTYTAPYVPPTYYELRARVATGDVDTRRSVARAHALPEDLMLMLASDADRDVRRDLAFRKDLTRAAVDELLDNERDGRMLYTLATNPSLTPDALRRLSRMEPTQVDYAPGWQRRRSNSPWPTSNAGVRALVAERLGLPGDLLDEFARDPDWTVRAAVAANPETPSALLDSLVDDPRSLVRLKLAENPRFTSLELLATDPEPQVCSRLAKRSDLPMGAVELLARDANAAVRSAIAARNTTPLDLLERLRTDSQAHVRAAAERSLVGLRQQSDAEAALQRVLEQWGIAPSPVLSVVQTVGRGSVFVGAGTLTQELQLLVPTHSALRSSLSPQTSIPERAMYLLGYRRGAPRSVALVIGGHMSLEEAIRDVSPHGNTESWLATLASLPSSALKNRTRYLSEVRASVMCSFTARKSTETEAAFSAALIDLTERLRVDESWRAVYGEAGAGCGLSVTTQCTPAGVAPRLDVRFGAANWDRAIDLAGAMLDQHSTRGAAVRMGLLAGSFQVEELRNVEVRLDRDEPDVITWFAL